MFELLFSFFLLVLFGHLVLFEVEDALFQLFYLREGAGEVHFVAAVVLKIDVVTLDLSIGYVCLSSLLWLPVAMYDLLVASRVECIILFSFIDIISEHLLCFDIAGFLCWLSFSASKRLAIVFS